MITVTFADGCLLATASKSLWQYDYGQQLEIVGLDLPEVFQVDFCNSGDTSTITVLGENNVVSIPDQFILDGRGITAFCFVYDETTGGTTRAEMKLPVLPRPERTEEQPDPEQEHVIDQLISELGENVEDAEAWAVGERDGVPVSEGDPTYNNSAKYWAGKAMTDAPVTSVNGKAGDIVLNLDDIPNGEQYARTTPAQIQQIGTNAADIADVEELIPAEASAGNQLADKYFVNNEIQTNSAHFRGAWPNWFSVPTDKNQYPADNKGIKTPSANDYIVVLDASGYPAGQTILSGTWRFSYVGSWEMSGRNGWKNEYQVNETALHTEQIAAINAKIPPQASASNQLADKILVNTKLMAYRTSADQDAIDSAQDGKINALTNLLNNKQTKITANGILKGNGNGGVSAAVAGMDYLPTSALYAYRSANAQDAIDNAQNANIDKNTAALNTMQPAATAADIGKALIVKTVADGKPTSYEYGEAGGGGGSTLTAGDGIDITEDVISNTQGIEYIVGTQTAATAKWTGVSTDETLKAGKIIAYYLPYAGTSTAATLALTMGNGTTTRDISLQLKPNATVTTQFPAGSIIILVYDGTYWRVNASYDTDTNTYPTGYCVTNGSVVAKAAACSFGYRGDTNYFPCLFRYANTAADATLAISTYAPEAAPIYVNGARTSASNTFGAGVILFLYYNGAYYCYNDGRFPILVDGAVTSVQEYATGLLVNYRTAAAQDTIDSGKQAKITATGILKGDGAGGVSSATAGTDYATPQQVNEKYAKPSGGIPSTDMTAAVQASLQKADTALQTVPDTYRTSADQDAIDASQNININKNASDIDDIKSAVDAVSLFEEYLPEKFEDTRYNRKVTICKNNITIEKTGADSTTYCHYSLFGHKFLGTGSSVPTSQLTDEDFISFTPYSDAFILQRFTTVVSSSTSIYSVITKNPETEEIKSVQGLNSKFGTTRTVNMFELLPDILSNGNFGLVFTSMSNQHDAEKFWIKTTMRPVLAVITNNVLATYKANKAYAVGDVLFVAGTLYRVTAAIANGAQLIPNTNIAKTTVIELINLSNS